MFHSPAVTLPGVPLPPGGSRASGAWTPPSSRGKPWSPPRVRTCAPSVRAVRGPARWPGRTIHRRPGFPVGRSWSRCRHRSGPTRQTARRSCRRSGRSAVPVPRRPWRRSVHWTVSRRSPRLRFGCLAASSAPCPGEPRRQCATTRPPSRHRARAPWRPVPSESRGWCPRAVRAPPADRAPPLRPSLVSDPRRRTPARASVTPPAEERRPPRRGQGNASAVRRTAPAAVVPGGGWRRSRRRPTRCPAAYRRTSLGNAVRTGAPRTASGRRSGTLPSRPASCPRSPLADRRSR